MYVNGGFGAWYDGLTFDRALVADWARRRDPSLVGDDDEVIQQIAQAPAQGGGFVAGGVRMCLSNTPGGQTEPDRLASQPCPAGSGGIAGEQVREITGEELQRQLEEQATLGVSRVTGRVVDWKGRAVAGAEVVLGALSTTTDDAGNFSIQGAVAGWYDLLVTAEGYAVRTMPGVRVSDRVLTNVGVVVLIASEESDEYKTGNGERRWYRNKWLWIGAGVVLVGGVTTAVVVRRRRSR